MDLGSRRGEAKGSVIVAGSVWETRMKNDDVKGGIKVFNGDEHGNIVEENGNGGNKKLSLKKGQSVVGVGVNNGKRKTWKNESFEGLEKSPIQIAKPKTQIRVATKGRSLEHCKELSSSVDGIKKSPVQVKKGRSEGMRELSKSVDGIERSPIHLKKSRSERLEERNPVELRKTKSDQSSAASAGNGKGNQGDEKVLVLDDQKNGNHVSIEEHENINGSESEENCKEFGVCQEMASNGNIINSSPEVSVEDCDSVEDDEKYSEEEEEEIEVVANEKQSFDIKEMHIPDKNPDEMKKLPETKPEKAVNQVKKLSQFHNKATPFSSTVTVKRATSVYTTSTKAAKSSVSASDDSHYQSFPQTQNKFQNLGGK